MKVTLLKTIRREDADPLRAKLAAAIERRAAADSALAEIRAAEKESTRSRWAAKAVVEKLTKADDDADADDELIGNLASGAAVDISAAARGREAELNRARADVTRWDRVRPPRRDGSDGPRQTQRRRRHNDAVQPATLPWRGQ